MSCTKEETPVPAISPLEELADKDWLQRFELLNCAEPDTRSDKTWDLDGFILYHTDGLRQMALSGSVSALNKEYCDAGTRGGIIPGGLGDDFEDVGYASVLELNGWLIAMYHPTELYPDNWIMYRKSDGYWERWDLGNNEINTDGPFVISTKQ